MRLQLFICLLLALTGLHAAESLSPKELASYLKKYPDADTDRDGQLGQWEYDAHLPPNTFGDISVNRSFAWVSTPDGVQLATEIFKPQGQGPFPIILCRSGYGRLGTLRMAKTWLVKGAAFVTQDPRGDGSSSGKETITEQHAFIHEMEDTYATCEWLKKQDWAAEKIIIIGGSGHGMAGSIGAWCGHPSILADATGNTVNDWNSWQFHNGVRRHTYSWLNSFSRKLSQNKPTTPTGPTFPWDALEKKASEQQYIVMISSGWYDPFCDDAIKRFQTLQKTGRCWATIGPRGHGGINDKPFPKSALIAHKHPQPQVDAILNQSHKTLPEKSQLRCYVMGTPGDMNASGHTWVALEQWPPQGAPRTLSLKDSDSTEAISILSDPQDPTPTIGGHWNWAGAKSGPDQQNQLLTRNDCGLRLWPVEKTKRIYAGPMSAKLHLNCSTDDTQIIIKVIIKDTAGHIHLMKESAGMLRFHDQAPAQGAATTPGTNYQLSINLGHSAFVVDQGCQLGLLVCAHSKDAYQVHPNSYAGNAAQTARISINADTTLTLHESPDLLP